VTLDRVRTLLDAYGADPARWPAAERAAALELLARSPDARACRVAAARLDDALDAVPGVETSTAIVAGSRFQATRCKADSESMFGLMPSPRIARVMTS